MAYICAAISVQALWSSSSVRSEESSTTLAVPSLLGTTEATEAPAGNAEVTTDPSRAGKPLTSARAASSNGSIRLRIQIGSATSGGTPSLLCEPFAGK